MPTPPALDALIFRPPCGPVVGWVDGPVIRATGIPYAVAERFGPPAPPPDRTDVLAATIWSPACPQNRSPLIAHLCGNEGLAGLGRDERCQRLSITRPGDARPDERLPVMVWIHGGSYVSGAGDSPLTDPSALVAEQRVLVVTVTYRLGLLGYLGDGDRPANLGLLDQRAALRWVRRNIAAFGGDPDNVTAFGESAGADAVVHLLAAARGERLFHRAIVQSAPLGIRTARQKMTAVMARSARDLSAATPLDTLLARQLDILRSVARFGLRGAMAFGVQYGHAPLPAEEDVEAAWDGEADVALLIGTTANETAFFIPAIPPLDRLGRLGPVGRLLLAALTRWTTRAVYGAGTDRFACRHARAGGVAHRYTISWAAPGNHVGSAHGIDLALLFGRADTWDNAAMLAGADWSDIDRAGRAVRALWADFARGTALPISLTVPGVIRVERR